VKAARGTIRVQAHGGGMMAGAARRAVTPELRQFVLVHDRRIAQLSGQVFGPAYADGLLQDSGAVLDSEPPTTAMLAAEALDGAGLDLLARLQQAHYVEGQRIAEPAVLERLAVEIGLDGHAFAEAYARLQGAITQAHFRGSRALLGRVGGQGFPTFALELDGQFRRVDIQGFLGRPDAWQAWLADQLAGVDTASDVDALPVCGLDGCTP
jgi:putative protein-disulfide isomerase